MLFRVSLFVLVLSIHTQTVLTCGLDWTCLSGLVNDTIQKLVWKKVAVVHDSQNAAILQTLQQTALMVYEINDTTPLDAVLHEIHATLFPEINVIVAIGVSQLLNDVMIKADSFDNQTNHSTDFSHHAKWIIFTRRELVIHPESTASENLQNIAVFVYTFKKFNCSVDTFSLKSNVAGYFFERADDTGPFHLRLFPNTLYKYNLRRLWVSTLESDPFVIARRDWIQDAVPYTGYCMDILRIIADHLNMTLQFVEAQDAVWGFIDNGMMGQLRRREIDLVASEMVVDVSRFQQFDYIMPFLHVDQRVLVYKMQAANEPIFLFAGPFQTIVYIAYFAGALAVMFLLTLIGTIDPLALAADRNNQSYWRVIKASLKQGDTLQYMSIPGSLLLSFWWLFVVLISSLYVANLTATLAASSPLMKFKNIDEVVDSDFSAGFVPGGMLDHLLKNSNREDVRRLYKKIMRINETEPWVTSGSLDYHIRRVKEGKYAFVVYNVYVGTLAQNDCNISKLYIRDISQESMSFVVQKHSPFKHDIEKVVGELNSRGILEKLWIKWTHGTLPRVCDEIRRAVTSGELIGAVTLACIGLAVASVSLLLELFIVKCKMRKA